MQASSVAKMALSAQGPGQLFLPFDPEYLEVCHMLLYDYLCWWAFGYLPCVGLCYGLGTKEGKGLVIAWFDESGGQLINEFCLKQKTT